ncbi:hypothetical protein [Streptomyces sp. NPDC017230]|uniref:hypothetical protein n=1 Tax=unclassified Streptomyces TaxID=2593676 RepID=UPI0037B18938
MRTKRLVLTAIAAIAVAGAGGTAIAVNSATQPTAASTTATAAVEAREALPARAPARASSADTDGPRVVRPYQPVEIGQGAKMGLLPEGRQNYVVAWDDYAESVEQSKGNAGDSIRPNSLSGGLHTEGDDALYTGAFRTDTVPSRITLRVDGAAEVEAGMLRLPGEPGWGTYYHDAAGDGAPRESVVVTAYGPGGSVLADLTFRPFPAGR